MEFGRESLPFDSTHFSHRELTAAEKRTNRKLGRIRVRVEHALAGVKRCRIVKGRATEHGGGGFGFSHGSSLWLAQPPGSETLTATENLTKLLFRIKSIRLRPRFRIRLAVPFRGLRFPAGIHRQDHQA